MACSSPRVRPFFSPDSSAGGYPPAFLYLGGEVARELSIFADESGADGLDSRYYLLTLVLHEQDAPLGHILAPYERALADKELPDIPFHASPLMNGHDRYEGLDAEYRLSQAADYACAVELAALKYQAREETATDRRFFGSRQAFKRNVLKTVRKKAL